MAQHSPRAGKRLVDIAEAADYCGCTTRTIRRRAADGMFRLYRFGPRLLRVDLDEIDAALRPVDVT